MFLKRDKLRCRIYKARHPLKFILSRSKNTQILSLSLKKLIDALSFSKKKKPIKHLYFSFKTIKNRAYS